MKRAVRHDDCNKVNMLLIDACLAERSQNNEVFQEGPARNEWLYPRDRTDRGCQNRRLATIDGLDPDRGRVWPNKATA